ncbi:MAG: hypothetical protein K2M69_09935 [Muribaculaceae bacterium]|nr:hypothetical protein [Muribaculaceae bacterium]
MAYKINDFTSPELAQVIVLRMGLGWEGYGILRRCMEAQSTCRGIRQP